MLKVNTSDDLKNKKQNITEYLDTTHYLCYFLQIRKKKS